MAALDWKKIDLNAIVDEDQLWELLASARQQVQEIAHTFKITPFHRTITGVNHNLFSVAGASGAIAASRPPLLWHRCWAWDSLSSTTRLLSGRSPLDQSSGFSHSTTVFSVATLLGASADRSKRGLVAISTSALPVRAGPRDCRHSLGGNSPPGNKENGSRQAVRCARAT